MMDGRTFLLEVGQRVVDTLGGGVTGRGIVRHGTVRRGGCAEWLLLVVGNGNCYGFSLDSGHLLTAVGAEELKRLIRVN